MKKSVTSKLLYNNKFILILSVVTAVLFWFIVVINVSPDYKRTVGGVKINTEANSQTLTAMGLHVVDKSAEKVSIEVTGPRNIIGKLNADSFYVTPNIGMISKAGSYELQLSASLKSPDNRVRITKVTPGYVSVKFDTMQIKTLAVDVQVDDNKVPDGYIMQSATSNPTSVTISGPTSELSQVVKAVAKVKVNDNTKETTLAKSKIVLFDSNGRELDLKHIQMSSTEVNVTIPILKTKQVALKADFINIPDGFDKNNIVCKVTPASILVAGSEEKIDSLKEISLDIDFSKLDITSTQTTNIPAIEGIMNVENVQTADISIQLKNTSEKVVSTNTFNIINQPSGTKVTVKTKQLNNINLFGPTSDIDSVNTVTAVVDMSSVQSGTGQYEVPTQFSVPGKSGYWVTGSYTVVVSVKKS
ncbi:MAG TPA: CdaR family protein [Ruminiclostridium sp.]|nr:CdaR family protein [Ruminiclostridium sp.]